MGRARRSAANAAAPPYRGYRKNCRAIVKFEYTGRFVRIVLEVFHREPPISRASIDVRRHGEEFRRKLLRKVIHKIGVTKT